MRKINTRNGVVTMALSCLMFHAAKFTSDVLEARPLNVGKIVEDIIVYLIEACVQKKYVYRLRGVTSFEDLALNSRQI